MIIFYLHYDSHLNYIHGFSELDFCIFILTRFSMCGISFLNNVFINHHKIVRVEGNDEINREMVSICIVCVF